MAATSVGGVIERLLEDDYLHEQISTASTRLHAAYRRSRALRAQQAAQDKKLYEHVREAAGALTEAARRALGKPEPEPPPRRARRFAALAVGVAVFALVRSMHRAQQGAAGPPAPSQGAAPSPGAAAPAAPSQGAAGPPAPSAT